MKGFKGKKIAIWGVGFLQVDIEAIYGIDKVYKYIDDDVEDMNIINIDKEIIVSSVDFAKTDYDPNMFCIICTKDKDYAIRALSEMGYCRENYVLAEELLTNKECYDKFNTDDLTIYGAGKTYLFWKNDLDAFNLSVKRFATSEKTVEFFDGKEVVSLKELKSLRGKTKIIVSSIYYKDIYYTLKNCGFEPGDDFIQLDTFLALNNLVHNVNSDYDFVDRSKGSKRLLVVLSGYKDFVWDCVFGRLEKYIPRDIDVCIVTSGKECSTMRNMCEKNDWSYLSTEKNNVSLAINLAICLHMDAQEIFKMDEDIFLTKNTFEELSRTYDEVENNSDYEVGFVTPLIPVNGYGYARVLDLLKIRHLWEKEFGEIKITDCYKHHMTIHDNPNAAEFLWGKDNPIMQDIDEIEEKLNSREFSYSICPVRYSIGLILFTRDNWLRMGMFPVKEFENMGADEKRICKYCLMEGRAMVVSENCIVGHLSYGPQHEAMEKYYHEHKKVFEVK